MTDLPPTTAPTPVPLEFEDVVLDLKRIVADAPPGYVYEKIPHPDHPSATSCVYFKNDRPSCIVGHVLARHGVSVDEMAYWNNVGVLSLNGSDANIIETDERTMNLLHFVQRFQDSDVPWETALELALENFETDRDPDALIYNYRCERKD